MQRGLKLARDKAAVERGSLAFTRTIQYNAAVERHQAPALGKCLHTVPLTASRQARELARGIGPASGNVRAEQRQLRVTVSISRLAMDNLDCLELRIIEVQTRRF